MCVECVLVCKNGYGYKWRSEVMSGIFLELADSGRSCSQMALRNPSLLSFLTGTAGRPPHPADLAFMASA